MRGAKSECWFRDAIWFVAFRPFGTGTRQQRREGGGGDPGSAGFWAKEVAFSLAFGWMDVPKARHREIKFKSCGGKGVGQQRLQTILLRGVLGKDFVCYCFCK